MSEPSGDGTHLTEDSLFGGRVVLRQPAKGYRVAIDPVFLAAAVAAGAGDRVLDVGCGVGAAMLCLARRVPGCRVTGLDVDPSIVRLASDNIRLNGLQDRVDVVVGDLSHPPPRLAPGSFSHIMTNPPYLEAARAAAPPDSGRARATVESSAGLGRWLDFCIRMARSGGSITMIHRADRLDEILSLFHGRLGEIVVFPLWPGTGNEGARRIVVRGRKDIRTPTRLSAGLVLHRADGRFTATAEAVLRGGEGLDL